MEQKIEDKMLEPWIPRSQQPMPQGGYRMDADKRNGGYSDLTSEDQRTPRADGTSSREALLLILDEAEVLMHDFAKFIERHPRIGDIGDLNELKQRLAGRFRAHIDDLKLATNDASDRPSRSTSDVEARS